MTALRFYVPRTLPKSVHWSDKTYLDWASNLSRSQPSAWAMRRRAAHMCYSEFNDIIQAIADMDADVITIETSRSDMELLGAEGGRADPCRALVGQAGLWTQNPSVAGSHLVIHTGVWCVVLGDHRQTGRIDHATYFHQRVGWRGWGHLGCGRARCPRILCTSCDAG